MENQCKGMTKAGVRCKVKNRLINGFCRLHQDQAIDENEKKNPESESSSKSGPVSNEVFPDTEIIDTNPETDNNKRPKSRLILYSIIIIIILFFFSKITEKKK